MTLLIYIDLGSVIIGMLLTGCALVMKEVFSWVDIKNSKPEQEEERFPIKFPEGPVFDCFCDAMEAINDSETLKDIDKAYIEIILFESCHPESESYIKDLRLAYGLREGYIKSHSI
jgi:hypothetical protein